MKFSAILLTAFCFYAATGQAQELPINPWAKQNHYVNITPQAKNSAPQKPDPSQALIWAERRAQQIEENNARRREALIAKKKAEQERLRQQAEAEAEAAAAKSQDGMLEKINSFFSDNSQPAKQNAQVATSDNSDNIDWQKEYEAVLQKTPLSKQSLIKLKNNYNRIKNINIDKMINDTMNDLQK